MPASFIMCTRQRQRIATLLFIAISLGAAAPLRPQPAPWNVAARAQSGASRCATLPEYRQLDFWLGVWDVQPTAAPRGSSGATNVIEPILGGCALWESWDPPGGAAGKGLHAYNARIKKWEQLWVTSNGGVVKFVGEMRGGVMNYETEYITPAGISGVRRTRIQSLDRNTVRQWSEASVDEGKTWTSVFDLTYVRKQ